MRFLHTADWHVGKTLKGHSRLDEQEQVLREIVRVVREQELDAVLVAGDLYDSAAPSAPAQKLVVRTLMALAGTGAEVIVIAGNHDHAATFDAYRPFAGAAGITLVGSVRSAEQGGVVQFTARTGEPVTVAVLPFVSSRYAVRAAELVANTPAEHTGRLRPAAP
jgi:exonuclease SbcD